MVTPSNGKQQTTAHPRAARDPAVIEMIDTKGWVAQAADRDRRARERFEQRRAAQADARSQVRHERLIDKMQQHDAALAEVQVEVERQHEVPLAARWSLLLGAAVLGACSGCLALHGVGADGLSLALAALLLAALPVTIDGLRALAIHDLQTGTDPMIWAPRSAALLGAAFMGGVVFVLGTNVPGSRWAVIAWFLVGALGTLAPNLLVAERADKAYKAAAERLRLLTQQRRIERGLESLRAEHERELKEHAPARRELQQRGA